MVKGIVAVIAAAVIAAVAVGLIPPPEPAVAAIETGAPSFGASNLGPPNLAAATQAEVTPSAANVQTEKRGCTQAWPYYEQACLHSNGRQPNGNTRVVRVIANDQSIADRALRARH
jgi:hypothetical protein